MSLSRVLLAFERVLRAGATTSPQTAEPAGMDAQGVANVVEPDGVGELGEEQAHDMTPRCEGACLFVDAMPACELGHEVGGNEFAKLGEDGQRGLGWFVFHQAGPEWDRSPATTFLCQTVGWL